MGYWNDNKANIDSLGNLTLGKGRADPPAPGFWPSTDDFGDHAQDATYPYAKGDAEFEVPIATLLGSGGTVTTVRLAANPYYMNIAGAGATQYLDIPLAPVIRTYATIGHGFLIKSVTFNYIIATADLTSISLTPTVAYALPDSTNVAYPASTAFGGTITGTIAGADAVGITHATTGPYLYTVTLGTPAWLTPSGASLNCEVSWVNPGASVIRVYNCHVYGSWALY